METIANILTIAKFEVKTLLRSWFFRIFAGLSLFILLWYDIVMFTDLVVPPLPIRGMSTTIPYVNLMLINVVQAVIAIFLSSDFLKRDKKLDTSEVIYIRPMSNGDYVTGKTLGILLVFITLNILVLIIAGVINLLFSDMGFNLQLYFIYPLLISIPTLVFILGLSFFIMSLIKNQAVTFILLLGYIAATLFYLSSQYHFIFDYMAFNVPMFYSDFTGFGNPGEILTHRGIYFLLGLFFISLTTLSLRRLPQSKAWTYTSLAVMVISLASALLLVNSYLNNIFEGREKRELVKNLNKQYSDELFPSVVKHDLSVEHKGEMIESVSKMMVTNLNDISLDKFIFNLNPSLVINSVKIGGENANFERQGHLLILNPGQPLVSGDSAALEINYAGIIDEDVCFPDIDEELREEPFRGWVYNIDKRHAFITEDYLLLTPESMWYPVSGVTFLTERPEFKRVEFTRFDVKLKTSPGLKVISQGENISSAEGEWEFCSETPLPQVSLIAGRYDSLSIKVDSVDYTLFFHPDHNWFLEYFPDLSDTMHALIKELKNDYESNINIEYPFKKMELVEAPLQFKSWGRTWSSAREEVQPQITLLPENALFIDEADFKRMQSWDERIGSNSEEALTDEEKQSRLFVRFVSTTITNVQSGFGFSSRIRGEDDNSGSPWSVYPNYYTFINNIYSSEWPIINFAMESYLNKEPEDPGAFFRRNFRGLTTEERANQKLKEQSLNELIADSEHRDLLGSILRVKGDYLFKKIQEEIDETKFRAFLRNMLMEERYKITGFREFNDKLHKRFGYDLISSMDNWANQKKLPAYRIDEIEGYQVIDGNRSRYQVLMSISNITDELGLVSVSFREQFGGGRGFRRRGGAPEQLATEIVEIPPGKKARAAFILDELPGLATINTLISANLPSAITHSFEKFELEKNKTPVKGIELSDYIPDPPDENVIIVDNEDPGFFAGKSEGRSFLKELLDIEPEEEQKYSGMNIFDPPSRWTLTTQVGFYGETIRSAHYTRAGDGSIKASWKGQIVNDGYYDVYVYVTKSRMGPRRHRSSSNEQYHYIVHHDDGSDEAVLEMEDAEQGWNFLGSFYFSAGEALIEITNESEGRAVIADAVKFVKQ